MSSVGAEERCPGPPVRPMMVTPSFSWSSSVPQMPVGAGAARDRHGGRVVAGLVDDQVGDDARVGIDHVAALAVVGVGDHACGRRPEMSIVSPSWSLRKNGSSRRGKGCRTAPNSVWPWTRLLNEPSTVRSPNGSREFGDQVEEVCARGVLLGNHDLVEDELQVGLDQVDARARDVAAVGQHRRPARRRRAGSDRQRSERRTPSPARRWRPGRRP